LLFIYIYIYIWDREKGQRRSVPKVLFSFVIRGHISIYTKKGHLFCPNSELLIEEEVPIIEQKTSQHLSLLKRDINASLQFLF
jgi:hypothetical protein